MHDPDGNDALHAALRRLEAWLGRHRRHYLRGLQPGASAAELAELEKHLGLTIPGELSVLLAWHNGQSEACLARFEDAWLLMSSDEIAQAHAELVANSPPGWQSSWIPFLSDDDGAYRCLDTAAQPPPLCEFWPGSEKHDSAATSLTAWMTDFLDHVERGDYEEDSERGYFVRKSGQQ